MTTVPPNVGDTGEAIAGLLDAHGDSIYHLGLRLCDEPEFAEDLVQETFLRAQRNWGQFRGESKALTWLYSIASRTCYRLQRRRAGQPRRVEPLDQLLKGGAKLPVEAVGADESPLEYTIRRDEVARLHRAISTLPAAFRLPLVLKEIEGLSISEVAGILGVRAATVKTRLHRARMTLRQELLSEKPFSPADPDPHTRRECADLLTAKLEAMDRGAPFPIENKRICIKCRATLDALDRSQEVCASIDAHSLPAELRERVEEALRRVSVTN